MEALGRKASIEASENLLGPVEQPPRKYTLDKGKAVDETMLSKLPSTTLASLGVAEQAHKDLGLDMFKGKAPKIEPKSIKKTTVPQSNKFLCPKKKQVGESSSLVPTLASHSRPPIVCKFCGKQFSTTRALGGHQNAHKVEREMQKAMKMAQEFGKNPFMFNLLGIRPPFFPGSYYEYNFPKPTCALKEGQARPNTANTGPGSLSVRQTPEAPVVPSTMRPMGTAYNSGWPNSVGQALGSESGSQGSTNFNANYNMFLQAKKNEARPNKKQCLENMGLVLSLNFNEPTEKENSEKQNKSTEFDLTLKL